MSGRQRKTTSEDFDAPIETHNVRRFPLTTVPNSILERTDLSFTAKGLCVYLLSCPIGTKITVAKLAALTPHDTEEAVLAAMKELARVELLYGWEVQT